MNNPLKAILIEGTTEQHEISYRLCPEYFQLQVGLWEIAINSVCVNILNAITDDYIFQISSNLVQGDQYFQRKLKKINIVLFQFKINKNLTKDVIVNNSPFWFVINNTASEHFSIFLTEWPITVNPVPRKDVRLSINVLFRRVL